LKKKQEVIMKQKFESEGIGRRRLPRSGNKGGLLLSEGNSNDLKSW
jgi:hypothetical protein